MKLFSTKILGLLFIAVILLGSLDMQAQRKKKDKEVEQEDVVYLNNGSVIRGKIIEEIPDEKLKIETAGGNIFVLNYYDIYRIDQETPEEKEKRRKASKYKNKGYYNATEFGILAGQEDQLKTIAQTWKVSNGYQFLSLVGIGAGIELDIIDDYYLLPIFFDLRGDLFKNSFITPYYFGDIGYNFFLTTNRFTVREQNITLEGGLYMNVGGGIKLRSKAGIDWTFGFGYQIQKASLEYSYDWSETIFREDREIRRFSFRTGVTF